MKNELIEIVKDEDGIVINIPTSLICHVTEHNPHTSMKVLDKDKLAELVAEQLDGGLYNIETGLTKFQELIDECIINVLENGNDCIDFKNK